MKGIFIQVLSSIILSIGNFLFGFSICWPSYTLELLKSPQSPVGTITSSDSSLIGSLPMLGFLAAVLSCGMLSDKIGRKKTEFLSGLCFVLSNSIVIMASNVKLIITSRFFSGFASGMHLVTSIPFTSEFSQSSIRGILLSIPIFSYTIGTLVSYVAGWLCSYEVVNYMNLTISVGFVGFLCFLKDSPAWLIGVRREKEALKSLKFYRGVSKTTLDILNEIKYMKNQRQTNTVENTEEDGEIQTLCDEKVEPEISAWKLMWTSKAAWRALVVVTMHVALLVFGGTIAVQTYAAQLFIAAAPTMSAHVCSVLLAIAFMLGGMLNLLLCDVIGRRPLMISSSVLCALCLAVLASLLRWSWGPKWMTPAAVLAYCCVFRMGAAIVPFIQLAECFPPKLKGLASTIALSFMCIGNFIVLAVFEAMVDSLGVDGTFATFAVVCVLIALSASIFMRETKGLPVDDIAAMFERGYLYRRTT